MAGGRRVDGEAVLVSTVGGGAGSARNVNSKNDSGGHVRMAYRLLAVACLVLGIVVAGGGAERAAAQAGPGGASAFTAMTPQRLVDTRLGLGAPMQRLQAGRSLEVQVTGRLGIPSSATAVVANVVAVDASGPGFLQLLPTGRAALGSSSTLNIDAAGQTIPNASFAPLGDNGTLTVYAIFTADVVIDVFGYFTPATSSTAGRLVPVTPNRILDTRMALGWTPPSPPASFGPLPTSPPATSPPAAAPPATSPASQPPNPGDTKNCSDFATYQQAKAWFDRYLPLYGDVANLDADNDGIPCESLPGRRNSYLRSAETVAAGTVITLQVAGRGGVPTSGVAAVVMNVTAVDPTGSGYVQVSPTPVDRGASSNLNTATGRTIANLVVVPLGSGGTVDLYTTAPADLLADVVGYFTDTTAPSSTVGLFVPITPNRQLDTREPAPNSRRPAGSVTGIDISDIASGAIAIAGNLTGTESTGLGYLQLAAAPVTIGASSNLNISYVGQTIANAVVSPVAAGRLEVYNLPAAHALLDVTGWFTSAIASSPPAVTVPPTPPPASPPPVTPSTPPPVVPTTTPNPGTPPTVGQLAVNVVGSGRVIIDAPMSDLCADATWAITGPTSYVRSAASPDNCLSGAHSFDTAWDNGIWLLGPGSYTVTLTLTNAGGQTSSSTTFTMPPTTVAPLTAPVSRVSTQTGGAQGAVTRPASESIFNIPADDVATGLRDPEFYYSEGPAISSNGRYVAFSTFLRLVPEDTDDVADVYRKDLQTGTTELVSIPTGAPDSTSPATLGGTASATEPAISADGTIVVFQSSQQQLTAGADNNAGAYDVFARRMVAGNTGPTVRLTNGNGASTYPDISDDGQFVTFQSRASDIVVGDTNSAQDGFVMTINPATLAVVTPASRVTVTATGAQATCAPSCNGGLGYIGSFDMRISNNGAVIVFSSDADNLVTGDTNGERDIFWVQRGTATSIQRISVTSSETQVFGGISQDAEPSSNGQVVVFHSRGNQLAPGDVTGGFEVYVRDIAAGTTTVLPGGNGAGAHPMISGDGNWISFGSTAANLVTGDTNGQSDVFLFNRTTQAVTRLSVRAADSGNSNARSVESTISADGDRIAFISLASNLVTGDTNAVADIFLYDRP